ncbi:hypothetical protein JS565_11805 [Salmonella enterica subsp. enterica serovar Senftenberg]|nr:hypothetical protein [Salmonella enterica subsp. enterica serovar Senftenberg]
MDIDNKKGLRFHVALVLFAGVLVIGGEFIGDFYFLREGEGAKEWR